MQDFLRFLRHLWTTVYFLRGIIFSLLGLLLACAIIVSIAQHRPLREGVYFILVTALTIGYGDITPQTPLGKVVSVAAGIIGILCSGIIVAISVRALEASFRSKIKNDDAGKR